MLSVGRVHRLHRVHICTDVDAEQAKPLLAMKKAWAAATAERLLEGKGWVPELMRTQPLQVAVAVEHPMGETEE